MNSGEILNGGRKVKRTLFPVINTLKISEERYRRLFETSQDGILIIDADTGLITDVNPFLADMLQYHHEDFIGKTLWSFGPFKDIGASQAAFHDLVRSGYARYENLPLEARDGQRIEVEFISNVYTVEEKRTIQCNIRDNAQHKQSERTRLGVESHLRQAQKMDAVATLAGGVAHLFNNALTVIFCALDLVEKEHLPEQTLAHLELIKSSADKMSRISRELLAFARGGKHKAELFLLSDLVWDSLPSLRSVLKPFITIETDLPEDLPKIFVDKKQIQTALLAVVANASEAIESRGCIRLICCKEVMTRETVSSFEAIPPGIYVRLTIEDNGKGMDAETRNRVFEPFFTTRFPGRGLGMAAVYGIVKNHDGWISVESEPDQGTKVNIYLPALEATGEAAAVSPLPVRRTRKSPPHASKTPEFKDLYQLLAEAETLARKVDFDALKDMEETKRLQLEKHAQDLKKIASEVKRKLGTESDVHAISGADGMHEAIRDIMTAMRDLTKWV